MTRSSTSPQQDPAAFRPGPGPWVGVAPDGSVIPAPYLRGAPDFSPAVGNSSGAAGGYPGGPGGFSGAAGGYPGGAGDLPGGVTGVSPGAAAASPRRRRADVAAFGAVALVGVLAVVAPFLQLWRYGFADGSFAAQTVVNGWGTVSAHPASFASGHSHDTDYGLPMVLAAGFLLAGAAAYARTRRAVIAALPIAVGATLAAGTALLLALDRGGRDSATTGTDSWGVGPGFWLIIGAAMLAGVVALAAVVLAASELRAQPPAPARSEAGFDPSPAGAVGPPWSVPVDPGAFTPPWAS